MTLDLTDSHSNTLFLAMALFLAMTRNENRLPGRLPGFPNLCGLAPPMKGIDSWRRWFTHERIADLERRFPQPGAKWRKRLAALKGETPVCERPVFIATVEQKAVKPVVAPPAPPRVLLPGPFERLKAEGARKRIEMLEAHARTIRYSARTGRPVG